MKFIFLMLSSIIFISCSSEYLGEKENNDSIENAQSILYGVIGNIDGNEDKDFYAYAVASETSLDFELDTPIDKPMAIGIYDYSGNRIKYLNEPYNDGFNTKDDIVTTVIRDIYIETFYGASNYYISIEPMNENTNYDKVDYLLRVKEKDYEENLEKEPNDNKDDAHIFYLDSTNDYYSIKGYYNHITNELVKKKGFKNAEIDFYKLENKSKLFLFTHITLSSIPSIDSSISIYDKRGQYVMTIDSNIVGDGESVDKLLLTPQNSYYLIVSATNKNNIIPYNLTISTSELYDNREFEPNNSIAVSQFVKFNNRYKGSIDFLGDKDYFAFNIFEKTSVKLSYYRIDSENLRIKLIDPLHQTILELSENNEEETLELEKGIYYLFFENKTIKKKGEFKTLQYEFDVSPIGEDYEFNL